MGKPIPYDIRVKIVKRVQAGEATQSVAEAFDLSNSGVRKIWKNFQKEGERAFETKYKNCGKSSSFSQEVRDAVAEIRDNDQGAYYVYSKLQLKYSHLDLPSTRTLNRWWVDAGTNRRKGRPSKEEKKIGAKLPTKLGK